MTNSPERSTDSQLALPPAYVLGLGSGGLATVRSLSRHGVRVTGLYTDARDAGQKSSHCAPVPCPDPTAQPDELVDFLIEAGSRLPGRGVLLPTTDSFLHAICNGLQRLKPYFAFSAPAEATLAAVVDKKIQYEIACEAGLNVPPTIYTDEDGELSGLAGELCYPAIVKPCLGHLWRGKGIVVNNPREAVQTTRARRQPGVRLLLQSFIPGPTSQLHSVGLHLASSGKMTSFAVRKVRQNPSSAGVGTMIETSSSNSLLASSIAFLRGMGYRGIGEIEFKLDARDGLPKFIEFNPRIWQQVNFALAAGIDFPWIAYRDLAGLPCEAGSFVQPAEPLRWLDFFNDLDPALREMRSGRLSPLAWIHDAITADSRAFFAWDDLRPFRFHAAAMTRVIAHRVRRFVSSAVGKPDVPAIESQSERFELR